MICGTFAVQTSTDLQSRAAAADDWGHIVHHLPSKVIYPTTDQEVADAILSARRYRRQITVRAFGHSAFGQAQCCGCIVMDMRNMNSVREVTDDYVYVEAGAEWRVALNALFALGKTTVTQTDWPGLSVGGVLSGGGGMGPGLFRHGFIGDHVLEITIVTGRGRIKTASANHNSDLFNAAISGMGQFGVITAVKLQAVDIPGERIRVYHVYQSFDTVFQNYATVLDDVDATPFDQFETFPVLNFPGTGVGVDPQYDDYFSGLPGLWVLIHEYGVFYDVGNEPNDQELFSYFDHVPDSERTVDMDYEDWINRLDFVFGVLLPSADFNYAWKTPHPWFEVLLPFEEAEQYITDLFDSTPPTDAPLYSVQSIIPFLSPTDERSFQPLPDSSSGRLVYVGLLRQVDIESTPDLYEESGRLVSVNSDLRNEVEMIGGTPVVTSTLPDDSQEWDMLLDMGKFRQSKFRYDPWKILGNSYGILPNQIDPCIRNAESGI